MSQRQSSTPAPLGDRQVACAHATPKNAAPGGSPAQLKRSGGVVTAPAERLQTDRRQRDGDPEGEPHYEQEQYREGRPSAPLGGRPWWRAGGEGSELASRSAFRLG